MNANDDELLYDEDDSVRFIQNYLPQELKGKFSDDDINYIVDLIYDYYESNGMLDDDSDEEVEIDEDEVVEYVVKNAMNGMVGISPYIGNVEALDTVFSVGVRSEGEA